MTVDPASTHDTSTRPPTASAHLSLAEHFSSYAEYATSTASIPRTAAVSLDIARFHAFTGELTLLVDPRVRLYLDGGTVYHAERDGDPSIGRRLLDSGVIDSMQLERGVVRVGDVDHLGRLFDRDRSIDRDAVMVVVEAAAGAVLEEVANSVVASVTVSPYRHHPSGIHRWFVAPIEPARPQRPSSGVAQVDRSVIEELPRLETSAQSLDGGTPEPVASMSIEWAEPELADAEQAPFLAAASSAPLDVDVDAELERVDAERASWAERFGGAATANAIPSHAADFHIVWPDGTREAPSAIAPGPIPLQPAAPVEGGNEPLRVEQLPDPDAAVPEDVAAAVRRALRAIEFGSSRRGVSSVEAPRPSAVVLPELTSPRLDPPTPPTAPEPSSPPPTAPPAPAAPEHAPATTPKPLGFAPPTMDTRAELVQQRTVESAPDASVSADADPPAEARRSESVQAQPDENEAKSDRRGALRRLIDNLRNSD